jgi:hypothetical protein
LARHIASHPVTVTKRDTVPRASRHMRPSLEGAVYVTRDQRCREGRYCPHHRHACVEFGERRIISVAAAVSPKRQGRLSISTADQQPRQHWRAWRACSNAPVITAIAHTVPTRQSVLRDNAVFIGISGIGPHDRKSREGLHARAILLVPTLEVRKTCGRARARHRRSGGACVLRCLHGVGRPSRGGRMGVAGTNPAPPNIDLTPSIRGLFPRNLWVWTKSRAIVFRRRPVLKKLDGL